MSKLTNKQKIEIYERKLKGETLKSLALEFNMNIHTLEYLVRLLNKHGYHILRNNKNKYCLLYTSPSPRDGLLSRMPSSA